jgi:uncharacterized membrane protein YgcG
MRKIILLLIFLLIPLATAQKNIDKLPGFDLEIPSNEKINKIQNLNFNDNEEINLIIHMKNPNEIKSWEDEISKMNEKEIKILKQVMRTYSINKNINKLGYSFDSFNGFSAKVNYNELQNLLNDPLIDFIEEDKEMFLFMQDTIDLINASSLWDLQINEFNLTGEGQSICVIDTGIDYTHNDLGGCLGVGCKVVGGYDFYYNNDNPIDERGHGTHVAGTIAANGLIKGIAPDAKLVAVNVFPKPSGGTNSSYVIAGIEYCINHKDEYNISVISMSLGGGLYSDYCDDLNIGYSNVINNAVLNNISVVVATGNDGLINEIASPACIKNVTRVGSSTKGDNLLSDFSNRWSKDMLIAPGSNINSTYLNNFYAILSGTSMSTPHVSGSIAILNQYLQLTEKQIIKPNEIFNLLNQTGNIISQDSRNYSRIDVFNAINSLIDYTIYLHLEKDKEIVNLTDNEINISWNANNEIGFNRTIFTIYDPLMNIFFNSTNSFGNIFFNNLNQSGNYSIIFYGEDIFENSNLTIDSFFVEDNLPPFVEIIINNDIIEYGIDEINISWNVNDHDLDLVIFNITYPNETLIYSSSNESDQIILTTNDLIELGNYTINLWANDSEGNFNFTSKSFFVNDTLAPFFTNIKTILPYNYNESNNYWFNITLNDFSEISNAKLFLKNSTSNFTSFNLFNENNVWYYNLSLSKGNYSYYFWANDTLGNYANITQVSNFIVSKINLTNELVVNQTNLEISSNITKVIIDDYQNLELVLTNSSNSINLFFNNIPNNEFIFIKNTTFIRENNFNLSLEIFENTKMISNESWDGNFLLIQEDNNFNLDNKNIGLAIKIGSKNKIEFDKPVKIILPNQKDKEYVAWKRDTTDLTLIQTNCYNLTYPNISEGLCKIDNGNDIIIWTYHFTNFVTFDNVIDDIISDDSNSNSDSSSSSGSSSGGSSSGGFGGGFVPVSTTTSNTILTTTTSSTTTTTLINDIVSNVSLSNSSVQTINLSIPTNDLEINDYSSNLNLYIFIISFITLSFFIFLIFRKK